jgi:hypothetical protein
MIGPFHHQPVDFASSLTRNRNIEASKDNLCKFAHPKGLAVWASFEYIAVNNLLAVCKTEQTGIDVDATLDLSVCVRTPIDRDPRPHRLPVDSVFHEGT